MFSVVSSLIFCFVFCFCFSVLLVWLWIMIYTYFFSVLHLCFGKHREATIEFRYCHGMFIGGTPFGDLLYSCFFFFSFLFYVSSLIIVIYITSENYYIIFADLVTLYIYIYSSIVENYFYIGIKNFSIYIL